LPGRTKGAGHDGIFKGDQDTYSCKLRQGRTGCQPFAEKVDTINHIKIEYTKFAYDYKKGVFQWQLLSSKIIFCVVVVVVFMGLYLSYMQFRMSAQRFDKVHERHQKLIENPLTTTKLEISRDGIKVDSAVIGLIILVISIVFFFLYLRFVFPIIDT